MNRKVDRTDLALSKIRTDGGTQPRDVLDCDAVNDYMDAMECGAAFPPVDIFYDGKVYWLAHGFHRRAVAEQLGRKTIACEIHQGTQQDAQWFSYSVNQTNGLRRTCEDRRRAIRAALLHPKGANLSDHEIAAHVGVAVSTVGDWRKKLNPTIGNLQSTVRTGHDGRTIDVSRIGKGRKTGTRGEHGQATAELVSKPAGTGKRAAILGITAAKQRMIDGLLSIEQTCTDMQRLGVERVTAAFSERAYEELRSASARVGDKVDSLHGTLMKRYMDSMPWSRPTGPSAATSSIGSNRKIAAEALGVGVADVKRAERIRKSHPEVYERALVAIKRGEPADPEFERLFKTPGRARKPKGE